MSKHKLQPMSSNDISCDDMDKMLKTLLNDGEDLEELLKAGGNKITLTAPDVKVGIDMCLYILLGQII